MARDMSNDAKHQLAVDDLNEKQEAYDKIMTEMEAKVKKPFKTDLIELRIVVNELVEAARTEARTAQALEALTVLTDDDSVMADAEASDDTAQDLPSAGSSPAPSYATSGWTSVNAPSRAHNPSRLVSVLAPKRLIDVANSINAGVDPAQMTLGLPRAIYAAWETHGYSEAWTETLDMDIPADTLECFISKWKLDSLARKGALKKDDELYVEFQITNEHDLPDVLEGVAKIVSFNGNYTVNLEFLDGDNKAAGRKDGCVGPKEILEKCKEMVPRGEAKTNYAWHAVKVRRQWSGLGTLYEIRQSVHRWQIEMDAWKMSKERE